MYEAFLLNNIIKKINLYLPRKAIFKIDNNNDIEYFMNPMNSSTSLKTIRVEEARSSKLIGILFAHPNAPLSKAEILNHLSHFHYRSTDAVDFFCVGYGAYWPENYQPDMLQVTTVGGTDWMFSDAAFSHVIDEIEKTTKWQYSGETELILLAAEKDKKGEVHLDFGSTIVCNLERMKNDEAFTSVRAFFEGIFKFAKNSSCTNPAWSLSNSAGRKVASWALKEAILSLLPKNLKKSYKKAEHHVVKDIG